ncbi:hypothetical protein ABZ936_31105, partial [Streptomyces sp. NPDC046685]
MDRRLIQTAVFNSPDSDEPALCPETPDELQAFRRAHEGVTIWCGTQFEGGCGRQLTTRLCTNKICHFAHYGSGGTGLPCGRKDRGKDSANHFFAKAHLASWLRAQGITATFDFPQPLGSAVTVCLQDGRTLLLHLDRDRPVPWDTGVWETILGPGVRDPHALTERGYLHRVRFDDRPGGGRIMLFGTEIHGRGTGNWDALDDIILTPEGLVSPTAEADARPPAPAPPPSPAPDGREIVTITRRTAPDPRRDDPVHELLRHLDVDNDTPGKITAAVARIRTLLETDLHPDDANRLRFALARCQRRMEEHTRRRQNVMQQLRQKPTVGLYHLAVELMRDDPDISQEERDLIDALAARMERLHAERHAEEERKRQEAEQERREGWRRQEARRAETARRASEEERVERAAVAEQAAIEQARQARAEKVKALAPAVRGALKKAARENRLTTWMLLRMSSSGCCWVFCGCRVGVLPGEGVEDV